jgi:hypothetical protein
VEGCHEPASGYEDGASRFTTLCICPETRRLARGRLALVAGSSVVSVTVGGAAAHPPLASGSAMVYRAPVGGPHHRDLTLRRDGARVVLTDALTGRVLSSHRTAALSSIAIEGANGTVDNTLTVDLSGGPIDATRGISWDGGVGGYNTLDVRGGGAARAGDKPEFPGLLSAKSDCIVGPRLGRPIASLQNRAFGAPGSN